MTVELARFGDRTIRFSSPDDLIAYLEEEGRTERIVWYRYQCEDEEFVAWPLATKFKNPDGFWFVLRRVEGSSDVWRGSAEELCGTSDYYHLHSEFQTDPSLHMRVSFLISTDTDPWETELIFET